MSSLSDTITGQSIQRRTPEQQLEHASHLWPNVELRDPPKDFKPSTSTEFLLFHVPDTFESLLSKITPPAGCTMRRDIASQIGDHNLRLAPGKVELTQPVWLAYETKHGISASPNELWGQPNLAASEGLSALIQFPELVLTWSKGVPAPNLPGYQLYCNGHWSNVPCFERWDLGKRGKRLRLSYSWAGYRNTILASPSVRVLI